MKINSYLIIISFISWIFPGTSNSQSPLSENKELAGHILTSRKMSNEVLKKCIWDTRTDVIKDGKVLDILIERSQVDNLGKIEKTILNDEHAQLPKSFLIHQIAEEEKNKIVNFLHGVHDFLQLYSLPNEANVFEFINKAKILPEKHEGLILLAGENILRSGDRISWWISSASYANIKLNVNTTFENDEIEFTAAFTTLLNGMNYLSFAEVLIPSKSISIQVHNYDYLIKRE